MNVPEGQLLRSRVVAEPREPLAAALDRSLTGYAVFEPQETLLLDAGGRGIVTFREGVPELVYYTGTDRGGPEALADLGMPGPYHVELFKLAPADLDGIGADEALTVPPGMPAERLAGDPALAASTRRSAPSDRDTRTVESADEPEAGRSESGAVAAFLEDEEKIDAIKSQAREEARRRAEEWDFG